MLDHYAVEKYVAACCDRAGIKVVWGDRDTVPSTDGKVINLPAITPETNMDELRSCIHYATHESSHVRFSDFAPLKEMGERHIAVANAFEDLRVNHLNGKEFSGDKINEERYIEKYIKKLEGLNLKGENATFLGPLLVTMLENHGFPAGYAGAEMLEAALPPEGVEKLKNLRVHPGVHAMLNLRDDPDLSASREIARIAGEVLNDVWGISPEEDKAESDKKRKAEKGDGEGESGTSADGEGSEDEDGDATGGGSGKSGEKGEETEGDTLETPYAEHGNPEGGPATRAMKYVGTPPKKVYSRHHSYVPDGASRTTVWDFPRGRGVSRLCEEDWVARGVASAVENADALADVVRRKLQVVLRDRWEHSQRRGRLDQRSLWRVGVPHDHYAERIFKRRIDNSVVDCAVELLVDSSGSMHGSKFVHAAAGSIILNNVFNNVLKMPTEILAFTEVSGRNTMGIVKGFSDRVSQPDMLKYFSMVGSRLCDNVDGESIMFGYHRLMQRPEKRKLMIVLSDGAPCGGRYKGSIGWYTTKVIDFIEKESKVDLIGVGIEDYSVASFYKNHVLLKDCSELEAKMLELVQTTVFKAIKEK